jgi:V/A-type H+/Na+-transporting ATPase subunit C
LERERIEPLDDDYYLFTAAELRAREKEFIDRSKLDRMIASESIADFFKVLSETYYAKYLGELEDKKSFHTLLLYEIKNMASFLGERLKDEDKVYIRLVFFEEIIHNVKLVIKAESLKEDLSDLFIPIFFDYATLKSAVENAKFDDLDEEFENLLKKAIELSYLEKNLRKRDMKLEKYYMDSLYHVLSSGKSRILKEFFQGIIDIRNIKNVIRQKISEAPLSFDELLYDNGNIDLGLIKKYENETLETFVKDMENSDYGDMIKQGYEHMHSEGSFYYFEKIADNYLLGLFEEVKYSVASLERIIAFFIRKKIESKNLNLIYATILYEADKQNMKQRLAI